MTDTVSPSPNHTAEADEVATTIRHGTNTSGWVVPDTDTLISDLRDDVQDGPHDAFDAITTDGFDLHVGSGEAVVGGASLCRDATSTVTIPSDSTESVYVGWAHNANDTVKVGIAEDFNDRDPRMELFAVTTDGSAITDVADERTVGYHVDAENKRYEEGGEGHVANANNVNNTIDGVSVDNYARTDILETFEAGIDLQPDDALVHTDSGGTTLGRVVPHSNALTDYSDIYTTGPSQRPRYVYGGLTAIETEGSFGVADLNKEVVFGVNTKDNTPTGAEYGGPLTWVGTDLLVEGETLRLRIENRTDRPDDAEAGRLIFRSDLVED